MLSQLRLAYMIVKQIVAEHKAWTSQEAYLGQHQSHP